jgi:hypothetical protein
MWLQWGNSAMRLWLSIALGFAIFPAICPLAEAQTKMPAAKRRVFVLHSGMHIILAPKDKNEAATTMKEMLSQRGIRARDVVALDSPFPTATFKEMVPKAGLVIYLESTDPKSRSSQDAYVRLHKALQAQAVSKDDDIVWIGHSAGGQMGMTMAHLAHDLDKFPELARKTLPYHFDTVITLGTAVGSNPVPANVKLRHYCSAGDTMVSFLSNHGNLISDAMESKVRFRPCCDLGPNAKLRIFPGVEHANWYADEEVLACILREFEPNRCPPWRMTQADTTNGVGLSQLVARSLESVLQISLEEHHH